MKRYKLTCLCKLKFLTSMSEVVYGSFQSNELLVEFYNFLKDIGVSFNGGVEHFYLTESRYIELHLRFNEINKIFRIESI